jgi:hypothetical protein
VRSVAAHLLNHRLESILAWVLADNPFCRFYDALGARGLARQRISIGGAALEEGAYGWLNLREIRSSFT